MKTTNKKEKNIYKTASQVGKFIKPVGKIALGVIIEPILIPPILLFQTYDISQTIQNTRFYFF